MKEYQVVIIIASELDEDDLAAKLEGVTIPDSGMINVVTVRETN